MTITIPRKNPNQALPWFLAGFLGLSFAYTYFFQFIYAGGMSKIIGGLWFLLLSLLFTLLAYVLVYKFAFLRIIHNGYSHWVLSIWFLVAALSGLYLTLVIPADAPGIPIQQTLEIIATGEANPQALGNEVRLISIAGPDDEPFDLSVFSKRKGWKIIDNQIVAISNFPTNLVWQGLGAGNLKLVFLTHPWSGVVKIKWKDQIQTMDLYSDVGGTKEVIIPFKASSRFMRKELFLSTTGIALGTLLFIASAFLVTRKQSKQVIEHQPRQLSWLVYSAPMALVWIIYLLTFWPGLMSPDSFDQWSQSTTGTIYNVHPAAHTLTILVMRKIWDTPGTVAIFQILTLSIGAGIALMRLELHGADRKILFITALIFALAPINGGMSITLWKDILYSVAFLGMMICTVEIVFTKGKWLDKSHHLLLLIFISLVLSLYRHNGLPVAVATFLGFTLVYPSQRKRFLYGFLILITGWFIITKPIYNALKIQRSTVQQIQLFSHYIAAHLFYNTPLKEEEIVILSQIMPVDDDWHYSCFNSDEIYYSPKYNHVYAAQHVSEIAKILLSLTLRNPSVTLEHLLCVSNNTWRISFPVGSYNLTIPLFTHNDNVSYLPENDFGIIHKSLLLRLEPDLVRLIRGSSERNWIWLAWRPALYLYIFLFGVIIKALRERDIAILYISLPVIFQAGVVFFLSLNNQDLRLHYPITVVSLIYSIYLILDPNLIRLAFAKSNSTV